MTKEELIIKDYVERFGSSLHGDKFTRLYAGLNKDIRQIFAYFHQEFNELFEFLNRKNTVNKHFNAHESRELIALINEFEVFRDSMKQTGHEVVISEAYRDAIKYCREFLSGSGGSPIPDDFEPIKIIKYDPVLELTNRSVKIAGRSETLGLKMVGQGAFSIVQKYKDPFYGRYFAVKQAKKTSSERELTRFKKEYEILTQLSFPYILEVFSFDEGKKSYVMEHCDTTLYEFITKSNAKLRFYNRKRLALQFLYGINYLHKRSILHRDISYRNVLIKKYDLGVVTIKLSDFGLMKDSVSDFTKSDTDIKGTIIDPSLGKFKDYSVQNEIYAVGFVLNFIFTGRHNLVNDTTEINQVVMRCTDRDPGMRYKNVSDLITEVESLSEV